jgi:hypothetical protein
MTNINRKNNIWLFYCDSIVLNVRRNGDVGCRLTATEAAVERIVQRCDATQMSWWRQLVSGTSAEDRFVRFCRQWWGMIARCCLGSAVGCRLQWSCLRFTGMRSVFRVVTCARIITGCRCGSSPLFSACSET